MNFLSRTKPIYSKTPRLNWRFLAAEIDSSIVSISSGRLWLATGEDLGRTLQRVILLVDATALLEALKQRIEDAHNGQIFLNRTISDAVVGKRKAPADPPPIPEAPSRSRLDPGQSSAQRKALTASITYIWGPPRCGKTHVLSSIVRSGLEAGKRILVCSNTNKAVAQVFIEYARISTGNTRQWRKGGLFTSEPSPTPSWNPNITRLSLSTELSSDVPPTSRPV